MEGLQGYRTDFAGRDGFVWWIGEVENIDDPSQLGRVKVRIIGWYTGNKTNEGADSYTKTLPTENLPWATVLLPTDKPQTKNAGTTTELQPGAFVMGFFLDGEEAQLPVVMGSFRGFRQADDQSSSTGKSKGAQETTKATTIASIDNAAKHETDTPQQKTMVGEKNHGGAPFAKTNSAPADAQGGQEEARGAGVTVAEEITPGNAVTNPIKPPTEAQEIADGAQGPAGKGFENGLTRMLTELGNMAAGIATSSDGQFISLITGHKINGDKILEHLGSIANYISSAIAGILAPLKEFLAEAIQQMISAVTKFISKFVPLSVILGLLDLLGFILDLFCVPHPQWLSLVQGALTDTTGFADQIVGMVVNKVTNVTSKIASKVQGVTDKILGSITDAISKVRDVAQTVVSAISTAKNAIENIGSLVNSLKTLFALDFSKLDFGSIIAIIKAILGMLFQKDCGRKIKKPKSKKWFPLLGSTECDDVSTFISGGALPTSIKDWKESPTTNGGYIDGLFQGINSRVMEVQSFLDGSRIIHNATKGKEFAAEQGPGGVSTFQDNQGNKHTNVPNNETKIIARDKCETIKKNLCVNVDGDYYLKVAGNWHIEVSGAINSNQANGPQSSASGSTAKEVGKGTSDSGGSTSGGSGGSKFTSQFAAGSGAEIEGNPQSMIFSASDLVTMKGRIESLEERIAREDEEFYSNLKPIPTPNGVGVCTPKMRYTNLKAQTDDDNEQKSANRQNGDHDIAYTGDVNIQGNQVSITAISNLKLNANQLKAEASNMNFSAAGEIINEANWITSFLSCGRFEFVALFNPLSALSGQFSIVKGAIMDVTTDTPGIGMPAAQVRMSLATQSPTTIADIIAGSQAGVHFTFVSSPTGGIGEIVASGSGAIINQVSTGVASYGVSTGFMAVGCAVGPNQVYGLPLLLN